MDHKTIADSPQIEGIDISWLDQQTILYVKFNTIHRNMILQFETYIEAVADAWNIDKPFLILVDFSDGRLSPHIKHIASTVIKKLQTRNIHGKRAVILPQGILAGVVKGIITSLQRQNPILANQFFATTEEALAWLREP